MRFRCVRKITRERPDNIVHVVIATLRTFNVLRNVYVPLQVDNECRSASHAKKPVEHRSRSELRPGNTGYGVLGGLGLASTEHTHRRHRTGEPNIASFSLGTVASA